MERITLQNYRCFGNEQSARLAPLTLLVGPNSTGKTSFLAALRALWDVAHREVAPDFRETPYDLGSFAEIAHQRSDGGQPAKRFAMGFELGVGNARLSTASFEAIFEDDGSAPFPTTRVLSDSGGAVRLEMRQEQGGNLEIRFKTPNGDWKFEDDDFAQDSARLFPMRAAFLGYTLASVERASGESPPSNDDISNGRQLIRRFSTRFGERPVERPVAGAPVRSRPRRTYDPVRTNYDPEGEYIPSYLADLYRNKHDEWLSLKPELEKFGRETGLFDEIEVRLFGDSGGDPFQIQVRKYGNGRLRHLTDVGYGVSQALPVLVELLQSHQFHRQHSRSGSPMLLLQQPEVHLHPRAQAALGTLLSSAAADRQIIVETHSDYIIDRVRMDVRDETTSLKPADVSILYFEPGDGDSEVKIHNIRLDQMGNVLDAPPSYGAFFMDEINRSIGLVKPNVRHS